MPLFSRKGPSERTLRHDFAHFHAQGPEQKDPRIREEGAKGIRRLAEGGFGRGGRAGARYRKLTGRDSLQEVGELVVVLLADGDALYTSDGEFGEDYPFFVPAQDFDMPWIDIK